MNVISVSFPPLARNSIPPSSWNGFILPHFHSGNHLRRIPEQLHTWKEYSTSLFKCGGTNWIQSTDDPPTNHFLTFCVPYLQLGVILLECGYCYGFPIAPKFAYLPWDEREAHRYHSHLTWQWVKGRGFGFAEWNWMPRNSPREGNKYTTIHQSKSGPFPFHLVLIRTSGGAL